MRLRAATPADAPLLRRWDDEPHVLASDPNDDWPIGFLQIIDPAREESHYWGGVEENLRAIDIWIGEADCLGRGYGTAMMRLAIERCFADPEVTAILVDPLESNTRAHRFYERLGFRRVGRRTFGKDDCLVMRLARRAYTSHHGQDDA